VAVAFGLFAAARLAHAARERELLAERAATEERLRIARELHDAVGHDVSLMVVQAQALGATAGDPRVQEATDAIAALGRRTMGEMHRTLRVLREEPTRAPAPGVDGLEEVVDGARAAGADVALVVEGAPRALPPALGATAYRIVQEAVTNAIRHAPGAPATVVVRYGPAALELQVTDEGPGPDGNGAPGHGLVGMRERAAAFGGSLEAGARAEGGFRVRAVLPYEGS
jgi:signal transduction histidine kinase